MFACILAWFFMESCSAASYLFEVPAWPKLATPAYIFGVEIPPGAPAAWPEHFLSMPESNWAKQHPGPRILETGGKISRGAAFLSGRAASSLLDEQQALVGSHFNPASGACCPIRRCWAGTSSSDNRSALGALRLSAPKAQDQTAA